jgi:hypothetical protein
MLSADYFDGHFTPNTSHFRLRVSFFRHAEADEATASYLPAPFSPRHFAALSPSSSAFSLFASAIFRLSIISDAIS